MRLYVENQKLKNDYNKNLKKYLVQSNKCVEIYSEEGIFTIDNNDIYLLCIMNEKHEIINNGIINNGINILIDKSNIIREKVHQLPVEHIPLLIHYDMYSLDAKSKLKMIVKTLENKNIPIDVYFEVDNSVDPTNISVINEINAFMKLAV